MSQREWVNVTKSEPCPICESPDWCSVSTDGAIAYCQRIEKGSFKPGKSTGWLHRLVDRPPQQPRYRPPREKRMTDEELHVKWEPQARRLRQGAAPALVRLARDLGVAGWSLGSLWVGYGELGGLLCWTFSELNAKRQTVGILRRLVTPINDKNKFQARGGRRGLTYAESWRDHDDPVYIVEGGSDTAAGLTLGLCVVGRPSNVGGLRDLVPLLGPLGRKRRIVVLGELDQKRHDDLKPAVRAKHDPRCRGCMLCWPGLFGAKFLSAKLRERLGRRVEWRMPPDEAKDLRVWLNRQDVNPEDTDAAFALGRKKFK